MSDDEPAVMGAHPEDLEQARRLPELFHFFETRTVQQLLEDAHWLSQYIIFRHHQEFQKVIDGIQKKL